MRLCSTRRGNARCASSRDRFGCCRSRALRLEPLEERTLLDSAGPRVLSHTPLEVRNDVFDHIDITFNEAIDLATFTVDDVSISGLAGPVPATGVSLVGGDTYRISFAALTVRGNYEAIVGPDITDLAGNLMDQNEDGTNGDPAIDFYKASFVYVDASVVFTSSTMIG